MDPEPPVDPEPPIGPELGYAGTYSGFAAGAVPGVRFGDRGWAVMTFDPAAGRFQGAIVLPWVSGSMLAASDPDGYRRDDDFSAASPNVTITSGSGTLCECEFLQWGSWAATDVNTGFGSTTDIESGYWVTGDITPAFGHPLTGSASYSGTAVGTVTQGGISAEARGDLSASVDFGTGLGDIAITDFDGRSFGADDVAMGAGSGQISPGGSFGGQLVGLNGEMLEGQFEGAFVADGTNPVGGIIGDFSAYVGVDDWYASGVFAGAAQP